MSKAWPLVLGPVLGSLIVVATAGTPTDAGLRPEPSNPAPAPALGELRALRARAVALAAVDGSGALQPTVEAVTPLESEIRQHVELLAQQLGDESSDPALVAQLLDEMSDADLRSAIFELTNLDARDLDGIRDVRDYSQRLATIAMGGLVTAQEPQSEPVPELTFSRAVDASGAPLEAADRFAGDAGVRIYAHFSGDGYAGDRVLVKWFREGAPRSVFEELLGKSPRMLVFGRYRIGPGGASSYVWASRERAWEPGRYRVELYDPSEPLRKLAAGNFVISTEPSTEPG